MIPDNTAANSIAADTAVIAASLRADPHAPVVHCPGWAVERLVRHHGDIMRWAAAIVRSGDYVDIDEDLASNPTNDMEDLAAWYEQCATHLLDTLADVDPHEPCWTFGYPPGNAGFWLLRQALEAAIHRWDAQLAVDAPSGFPPEIAIGGITEVVHFFFPRQIDLDRTPPLSAAVTVASTDLDNVWTIPGSDPIPAAELTGSLDDLLLLLWRRRDLDDGSVTYAGPADLRSELAIARFTP